MNKIKMFRNIKDIRKKDFEKENGWNNRFTTNDHTQQSLSINGPSIVGESPTYLRPKNLRQSSSKSKIKTEGHQRTKSAIKLSNQTQTPKNNEILSNDPLYSQIKSLWSILGVTQSYKNIFDNVSLQLVPIYREGYFNYEIKQLINLSSLLSKTNKDIDSREKIIQLLKKFDKYIVLEETSPENKVSHEKLIADISKTLNDLRVISLSIVNSYLKIRKEIAYDVLMNKHDLDNMVNFNKHYLLQMKNDTDFLSKTSLAKYFSFANESDPFLTAIAVNSSEEESQNESNPKYTLPIDNNMIETIKDCQYIMLQEMIYNECNKVGMIKADSSLSNYSIKSIKSAKKITQKNTFEIDSILSEYKKDSIKHSGKIDNKILTKKFPSNTSKKDLKPIRTLKSPDYMKIKKRAYVNGNNNEYAKYSAHNTEVKTPKKMNMNVSNNETLGFEDSKMQEKKNGKCVSKGSPKYNKAYKTEIDCLEEKDLRKIDEIINRSIKQKLEIDKLNQQLNKEKESENDQELDSLIIKDQREFANEMKKEKPQVIPQEKEKTEKEEKINEEVKEELQEDKAKRLLNKMDEFLQESHSCDVTQIKNIESENVKHEISQNQVNEEEQDSIPDEIEIKDKEPSKVSMIVKDMTEHDMDSINPEKQYSFSIFNGELSSISGLYSDYYHKIPQDQVTSFNLQENILAYLKGTYPKIVLVKDKSSCLSGLITLSYDYLSQTGKSLTITSISTLSLDTFGEILVNFVEYCNEYLPYDEITIDFFYGVRNGQFYMIKELESAIKTQAKFKWVNMENDGVNRKIKYKYRKTKAVSVTASLASPDMFTINCPSVLSLQSSALISLEQLTDYFEGDVFISTVKEKNDFNLLCLIGEIISKYEYQMENENDNEVTRFINKINVDKLRKLTSEIVKVNVGFPEEIIEFIMENLNQLSGLINSEMKKEKLIATSLMKIETNFENIIKSEYNGYEYNLINNDIEVFELKSEGQDQKFYLLHSTNENVSFLIYEFENGDKGSFSKILNENNEEINITEAFKKIYMKIDQQPANVRKKIFLPSFKLEKGDLFNNPSIFQGIRLQNETNEFLINNLNLIEKIEFGANSANEGSIIFEEDDLKEGIVINNDFLIATIHSDLLCDLQIPTVSAFIIGKDKWISK